MKPVPCCRSFFAALTAVPAAGPKQPSHHPTPWQRNVQCPHGTAHPMFCQNTGKAARNPRSFQTQHPQAQTTQSAKRPYRWPHDKLTAIVWRAKAKRFPFACPNVRWNVLDVFASVAAFAPLATLVSCWPRINR